MGTEHQVNVYECVEGWSGERWTGLQECSAKVHQKDTFGALAPALPGDAESPAPPQRQLLPEGDS